MPQASGAKTGDLRLTFAALRESLAVHSERLLVTVDQPCDYQLCSRTLRNRIGRPLFVAGIQIKKNYVSYHLLPIYMAPALQKKISPTLKKQMQGKACFNFTAIESQQLEELAVLTRQGIEVFNKIKLPWEKPAKR
jgi:hypothetical protein